MNGDRRSDVLPRTRAEAIASELRRAILAGEFTPGTRLRQAEIAARYSVSTTPVREAFTALAREGLVSQDAHRGVTVFHPTVEELEEIYEIREALEPLATSLAASRLTSEEVAEIEKIVAKMKTADPVEYVALNQEFHSRIYAASGRPRLTEIINTLRESSTSYTGMTVRRYSQQYRDQVQAEHEAILAALRKGSSRKAATLVRTHLANNERHVAAIVKHEEQ